MAPFSEEYMLMQIPCFICNGLYVRQNLSTVILKYFFQIDKGMATKRPVADVFQIYVNYVHGYVFFNNYNEIGRAHV